MVEISLNNDNETPESDIWQVWVSNMLNNYVWDENTLKNAYIQVLDMVKDDVCLSATNFVVTVSTEELQELKSIIAS